MKKAIKNAMKIKISEGNTKLGTIANISLTPGKTCSAEACKTCMRNGCYAMKAYKAYPTTRAAWDNNTDTAINDLARFESDLMLYFGSLNAPRFFRVHVAGDFVSREYAAMWARVAACNPGTNFLAFTKQWDNVRGVEFPENVSIVLSAWPGTEIPADLRKLYSVAWLNDGTTEIPTDALECPGNCETCGVCWSLSKRHIDVFFNKH
jgi:hypothetical protein